MRHVAIVLLYFALVGHAHTADSLALGGISPSVSVSNPSAGQVFAVASNSTSAISYSTDGMLGSRKITVEIDDLAGEFPSGTRAQVTANPGQGEGTGTTVTLTTTATDLIRDIPESITVTDLPLSFEFASSLGAVPESDSRTIRYTILMQ